MLSPFVVFSIILMQGGLGAPKCSALLLKKDNNSLIRITVKNTSNSPIILISPNTPNQILDNGRKQFTLSTRADEETPYDYSYTPKFVSLRSGQTRVFSIPVAGFKDKPSDMTGYSIKINYAFLTERDMNEVQNRGEKPMREVIIATQHILEGSIEFHK